jgi:hypothetical protein
MNDNELPLTKQFVLQKIYNDIDTLNEEGAKKIAKELAKLYHVQQHVIGKLLLKS